MRHKITIYKKYLTGLTLCLFILTAAPAWAENAEGQNVKTVQGQVANPYRLDITYDNPEAPFEGQAPMTKEEAKAVLKAIGEINKINLPDMTQEKYLEIVKNTGLEKVRYAYVSTKLHYAISIIINGPDSVKKAHPWALPTEKELALVKKLEPEVSKVILDQKLTKVYSKP